MAPKGPDFKLEPPRGDLKWVAIDLDGTLAESVWTPDNPVSEIGPVRPGVKAKVDELVAAGYKIVIHTSRPWTDYENIEKWCIHNEIPFKHIVPGKLLAAVYIDDRALNDSESSWLPKKAKELHEYGSHLSILRQEYEAFPQRVVLPLTPDKVEEGYRLWDKKTNGLPARIWQEELTSPYPPKED